MEFKIGDKVFLKKGIPLYNSSNANYPSVYNKMDRTTIITRKATGSKHPYNSTGDLGWMNTNDIKSYEEPKPEPSKYECEIELIDKTGLIEYLKTHQDKIIMIDSKELKDILGL